MRFSNIKHITFLLTKGTPGPALSPQNYAAQGPRVTLATADTESPRNQKNEVMNLIPPPKGESLSGRQYDG